MSKSFLITSLVVFCLVQIIGMLLFWFSISNTIWGIQANQQSIVTFLQQQQTGTKAPATR